MTQEAGQLYGKWENDTGSGAVIREVKSDTGRVGGG